MKLNVIVSYITALNMINRQIKLIWKYDNIEDCLIIDQLSAITEQTYEQRKDYSFQDDHACIDLGLHWAKVSI